MANTDSIRNRKENKKCLEFFMIRVLYVCTKLIKNTFRESNYFYFIEVVQEWIFLYKLM